MPSLTSRNLWWKHEFAFPEWRLSSRKNGILLAEWKYSRKEPRWRIGWLICDQLRLQNYCCCHHHFCLVSFELKLGCGCQQRPKLNYRQETPRSRHILSLAIMDQYWSSHFPNYRLSQYCYLTLNSFLNSQFHVPHCLNSRYDLKFNKKCFFVNVKLILLCYDLMMKIFPILILYEFFLLSYLLEMRSETKSTEKQPHKHFRDRYNVFKWGLSFIQQIVFHM